MKFLFDDVWVSVDKLIQRSFDVPRHKVKHSSRIGTCCYALDDVGMVDDASEVGTA